MAKKATTSSTSAPQSISALNFLSRKQTPPAGAVCILFGDDHFLIREVAQTLQNLILVGEDSEFSFRSFDGGSLEFNDLYKELFTASLFGESRRLVQVEKGDAFLSNYRDRLEQYLDSPSQVAVLLLIVQTFASNTRLYKKTIENSLVIDCRKVSGAALSQWVVAWGMLRHQLKIEPPAAQLLVELIGDEPGLLDQETARLALLVPAGKSLDVATVNQNVGSFRTKKIWDVLDAAMSGDLTSAMTQLNALIQSGEAPVGIFLRMTTSLRQLAKATRMFLLIEEAGRKPNIDSVLTEVGFPPYFIKKYAKQMIQLGRRRGAELSALLLQADLDMKGGSRTDPTILLQQFLVRLGHPQLR